MRARLLLLLLLPLAASAAAQLPEVVAPPGNPVTEARASLGKALFWDEQLSAEDRVACGTCHRPGAGGSDPRAELHVGPDGVEGTDDDSLGSPGTPGHVTARRPRSVIGAAFGFELFWDGRAEEGFVDPVTGETVLEWGAGLESQAVVPIVHHGEMGAEGWGWDRVTAKLERARPLALSPRVPGRLARWIGERGYPALFEEAFGDALVTPARIAQAIAGYERTLIPDLAPVLLYPGGGPDWTRAERDGLALFRTLTCSICHPPDQGIFTDQAYHYLGTAPRAADEGLGGVTGIDTDRGRMRTPSLLNVALRPPFFHDGSQATLADVVEFYDRGGDHEPNEIGPLDLSAEEKEALVAFLGRPLTDPRLAAGTPPFDRPLLSSEEDPGPAVLAGMLRLEEAGAPAPTLFTWRGEAPHAPLAPGDYLPVEFPIPDRPVLVGRTLHASWVGPLGRPSMEVVRVVLRPELPR